MFDRLIKQLPLGMLCRVLPGNHPLISHRLHDLVFKHTNLRVAQGPFAGLKISHESVGSELLPKVTGTYEKELHEVIEEFIASDYDTLLNIGCAEGYYATGFAARWKRLPRRILAFDVNPAALQLTRRVAEWNGVADKMDYFSECRHENFAVSDRSRTLVICDIEGAERDLLDPELAPGLRRCDLLVEMHDGQREPLIRRMLEKRFAPTHQCRVIRATQRTCIELGRLAAKIPARLAALAMDERRSDGLEWMVMRIKRQ
jgi:hypothetical protein